MLYNQFLTLLNYQLSWFLNSITLIYAYTTRYIFFGNLITTQCHTDIYTTKKSIIMQILK